MKQEFYDILYIIYTYSYVHILYINDNHVDETYIVILLLINLYHSSHREVQPVDRIWMNMDVSCVLFLYYQHV